MVESSNVNLEKMLFMPECKFDMISSTLVLEVECELWFLQQRTHSRQVTLKQTRRFPA